MPCFRHERVKVITPLGLTKVLKFSVRHQLLNPQKVIEFLLDERKIVKLVSIKLQAIVLMGIY